MSLVSCRSIENGEFVITLYLVCDHERHVGDRDLVKVSAKNYRYAKVKAGKLGWVLRRKKIACPVCDDPSKQPVKQVRPAIVGQPHRPFIQDPLPFVPLKAEEPLQVVWTRKELEEDESFIPTEVGFEPTSATAGTAAKIEVLRQRAARGNPLFHVSDKKGLYSD